ncbi:MAG: hypothetical protein AB1813_26635 [Verrucomicrobiota bacterium]
MLLGLGLILGEFNSSTASQEANLPTLDQAMAARPDVWGEAALRQTNGPSYEFFERLLPPLRYVNADFRYYPIVLSAPKHPRKARLISNGSGLNLPGGTRSWNPTGVPVTFRVGPDELRFGEFPHRLEGPRYHQGYLPIVQIDYAHGEAVYRQESFAVVDSTLAEHGVVFLQLALASGTNGNVAVQIDLDSALQAQQGRLLEASGKTALWFDGNWRWTRQRLVTTLAPKRKVALAIPLQPIQWDGPSPLQNGGYEKQRTAAIQNWNALLSRGLNLEIPEPVVQNAWRSLVIGTFSLIHGERMHYSAGNQYDRLYQAEGCDAVQALLGWGFHEDVRPLAVSQLEFTRKGLEYHQAGHKLQLLADYFWQTRDGDFVKQQRPRWQKEVQLILQGRTNAHGLFPREQYCGDVATPVFSLNSNAKCWRALRDFAVVLDELGHEQEANRLAAAAAEFRMKILSAIDRSVSSNDFPGFIPIALLGEEQPYDPITGTKIGSYWNLMANYVIGSRILGRRSPREIALLNYLEHHGGLCMGLTRSRPNPTFWTGPHSVNPLYGMRRVLALLENDEPDRALVSFYGMLAQGFTRETFLTGEGGSLTPLDERGRLFYCPPNSAGNAFFLNTLRHLLVQDIDLNEDGRPETLRLLFGTPRMWLAEGKTIRVERASTAFGEVNLTIQSHLDRGEVICDLALPSRNKPDDARLRARLPEGWSAVSATSNGKNFAVDSEGTIDISGLQGKHRIRFEVQKNR